MTTRQQTRLFNYLTALLSLDVDYINYLTKCNDPNDDFNKLLERVYNDPLSEKVQP